MTTKTFSFDKAWKQDDKKYSIKAKGQVAEKGCPKCKQFNIQQTGRVMQDTKWRVYYCNNCKEYIASPTTWAECNNEEVVRTKDGLIGRDTIIHDCLICPIPKKEGFDVRKLLKEGKACPYWAGIIKMKKEDVIGE